MRHEIHHQGYRAVVFKDIGTGYAFLTRSTIETTSTTTWEDGREYPVAKVELSSSSHPLYTGKQRFVDAAGRIERFEKKFGGRYLAAPTRRAKPAGRPAEDE